MYPSVYPALRSFLNTYEGLVNYMYLDRKGLVTTGVGFLIDPKTLAHGMQWTCNANNRTATSQQIDGEWDQIHARQIDKARGAGYFRQFTTLHLQASEIDRVFRIKADRFEAELRANSHFREFFSFPADAQLAILIHAWANGTGKLNSGWPKYSRACQARDWKTAARECAWQHMNPNRKRGMETMFENAANIEAANQRGFRYDPTVVQFPTVVMEVEEVVAGR